MKFVVRANRAEGAHTYIRRREPPSKHAARKVILLDIDAQVTSAAHYVIYYNTQTTSICS